MAEIDEILQEYIDNNRDVTFPIHYEDRANLPSTFVPFGFSADGSIFTREWVFNFATNTRVAAAFTGVLFVHTEAGTGNKYIHIRSFAQRPLNRISGLPPWYPIPQYARYGPFSETDISDIIRDLFTNDNGRITFLTGGTEDTVRQRLEENANRVTTVESSYRAQLAEAGSPPPTDPILVQAVRAVVRGDLNSGVPIAAGEVLIQHWPGTDLKFSLHPARVNHEIEETLYFDPHFYFYNWRSKIENYNAYPTLLRSPVLAPPISTGSVVYIKSVPDPAFPTAYQDLPSAIQAVNSNDILIVLDNAIYNSPVVIPKYLSLIGLGPADNDVTLLDSRTDTQLDADLPTLYPVITNTTGRRGVQIWYDHNIIQDYGLVYLRNIAVMNNQFDVRQEVIEEDRGDIDSYHAGGAGIIVNGIYYGSLSPPSSEYCKAHIHNCAVYSNAMFNFPDARSLPFTSSTSDDADERVSPPTVSFCGGGILCYQSSPMITKCLIRKNTSYFHGGGIGVYKYGFPVIRGNIISFNRADGHPFGDLDGGEEPGGNGDGGGIGVFQAYPENRGEVEADIKTRFFALASNPSIIVGLADYVRTRLPQAWDTDKLRKAKSTWIRISENHIHHNVATMSGGGVYGTVCALLTLWNNKIEFNTVLQQDGGGIACTYGSKLIINGTRTSDNFIQQNESNRNGGGIYIRSSKAIVNSCRIRENRGYSTASIKGGGLAIFSTSEIQATESSHGISLDIPQYDIIQSIVFDHIDKVEFVGRDIIVDGNSASRGQDVFAIKDESSYDGSLRTVLVSLGIINILQVHIKIDPSGSARGINLEFVNKDSGGNENIISPTFSGSAGSEIIENTF